MRISKKSAEYLDFCLYTGDGATFGRTISVADLRERFTSGDFLARAENSGSEGCYIEVARWSDTREQWERFAFLKVFGGEVTSARDLSSDETAEKIASLLNAECTRANGRTMIHNLPTWQEEAAAVATA
jgi:hypothetical protein